MKDCLQFMLLYLQVVEFFLSIPKLLLGHSLDIANQLFISQLVGNC
jgi:hypothetical protein